MIGPHLPHLPNNEKPHKCGKIQPSLLLSWRVEGTESLVTLHRGESELWGSRSSHSPLPGVSEPPAPKWPRQARDPQLRSSLPKDSAVAMQRCTLTRQLALCKRCTTSRLVRQWHPTHLPAHRWEDDLKGLFQSQWFCVILCLSLPTTTPHPPPPAFGVGPPTS